MKHSAGLLTAQCHAGEAIYIRQDSKYVRVLLSEITYIKAFKNYIRIITPGGICTPLLSMKQMEAELPANLFCRVHRSYIVSIRSITAFDHERVFLGKIEIPLGENHRNLLMEKLKVIVNEVRQPGRMTGMTVHDLAR